MVSSAASLGSLGRLAISRDIICASNRVADVVLLELRQIKALHHVIILSSRLTITTWHIKPVIYHPLTVLVSATLERRAIALWWEKVTSFP